MLFLRGIPKTRERLEIKREREILNANRKKVCVAIVLSENLGLKAKLLQ